MKLNWTEAEAKEFLRKITGAPVKVLEGIEYDQIRTLLALIEPNRIDSSNQRSIVETYNVGGMIYRVHYFSMNEDPRIELMLEENNE